MAQRGGNHPSISNLQHVRKMIAKRPATTRELTSTSYSTPAFLSQPDSILVQKFKQILEHENSITSRPGSFHHHAIISQRDRYPNIRPWAHNRVTLSALPFPENYINASPVNLGRPDYYIATQGPGAGKSADHFWHMTWQEDVRVIMMLTQHVEAGIEKCGVYLPLQPGEIIHLGGPGPVIGSIECLSRRDENWGEMRELSFRISRQSGLATEERRVYHFLFSRWPDHDVPRGEDLAALFMLIQMSRRFAATSTRIIHCSAGVGRTGAFIALDYLIQELNDGKWDHLNEDDDPIFDTVKRMRDQRMGLVHTVGQYVFVYRILRDKWEMRNAQLRDSVVEETEETISSSKRRCFSPSWKEFQDQGKT